MITFFAIPKPFTGHFDLIQRNAIQSWLRLRPSCEIFLFGNDPSIADAAREFGVQHSADIVCNSYGTPLISDIFEKAQNLAAHRLLCYLNADIILLNDFIEAAQRIELKRFLMVERRWNIEFNQPLDFNQEDWEIKVRKLVASEGILFSADGIDVFLFTHGLWGSIPPFAVGRAMWDNWMIYRARALKVPVVDATGVVTIIHQNHTYAHLQGGKQEAWEGPEAAQNRSLAGGYKNAFTIHDASWLLTPEGLRRPKSQEHVERRKITWPALHPHLYAFQQGSFKVLSTCLSLMRTILYTLARRARSFLHLFR